MIITAINLIGGMIIGITHGMSIMDSLTRYSELTVGDGVISQIPALIIAVTAGILVTKSNTEKTLSEELESQLLHNKRPLWIGAEIIFFLAMMLGMPRIPFLSLGIGLLVFLSRGFKVESPDSSPSPDDPQKDQPEPSDDLGEFLLRDRATIEVGARLVTMMNPNRGKTLAEQITALRKGFSKERGQSGCHLQRFRKRKRMPIRALNKSFQFEHQLKQHRILRLKPLR